MVEKSNLDTSSQSSQDDLDADDMNDKGLPTFCLKFIKIFISFNTYLIPNLALTCFIEAPLKRGQHVRPSLSDASLLTSFQHSVFPDAASGYIMFKIFIQHCWTMLCNSFEGLKSSSVHELL